METRSRVNTSANHVYEHEIEFALRIYYAQIRKSGGRFVFACVIIPHTLEKVWAYSCSAAQRYVMLHEGAHIKERLPSRYEHRAKQNPEKSPGWPRPTVAGFGADLRERGPDKTQGSGPTGMITVSVYEGMQQENAWPPLMVLVLFMGPSVRIGTARSKPCRSRECAWQSRGPFVRSRSLAVSLLSGE